MKKQWSCVFPLALCILGNPLVLFSIDAAARPPSFSETLQGGNRTEDIRQLPKKEVLVDFREVAKKAIPTVVSIKVKGQKGSASLSPRSQVEDPFELFGGGELWRFFGLPRGDAPSKPVEGQASGVIVDPNGYILTNSHVIHGMDVIFVTLHDGREFKAKVLGDDPISELALIKIEAQDLPFLTLGNSDDLEVGQWVAAIGNPFGLQATLTVGVVSAKGRNNLDIARQEDFIQTDAAINQGNSGGPLISLEGEIVGINTAIATTHASGYIGIGFAIPSNMARNFMEDILADGKISRGFLGVSLQSIDANLAKAFDLPKVEGALISNVAKNSPAEKAGLMAEDVIVRLNHREIESAAALRNEVYKLKPGTRVTLSVWRKDRMVEIAVTLGENPENAPPVNNPEAAKNSLGIEVGPLTAELSQQHSPIQEAVVVTKVYPGSVAALAGLKKGALILGVNRQKVSNIETFNAALAATPKEQPVLLQIKQGDLFLFVSLQQSSGS